MTRIYFAGVDVIRPPWYLGSVAAHQDTAPLSPTAATPQGRQRRRPPSLSEQQRRTARIRPWAEQWKQLKAAGTWR